MINQQFPFSIGSNFILNSNDIKSAKHFMRNLSDMRSYFLDQKSSFSELNNPVIYEFWEVPYNESDVGMNYCLTSIFPGKIGKEYFMTKGHFHQPISNEVYITISGKGLLLLQSNRNVVYQEMVPGIINAIPAGWAHRSINTSNIPLVFFSVWAKGTEHDYQTIQKNGFLVSVIEGEDGNILINTNSANLIDPNNLAIKS